MNASGSSPLGVDPELQQQRLRQLRDRFDGAAQPLRLTLDALTYWHHTADDPQPLSQLTRPLRDEARMLVEHGLVTSGGTVPDDARLALGAMRAPLCTIDVEAKVGRTGRHYRAWVGPSCAVLYSTDPPWAGVEPTAEAVAARDQAPAPERLLQLVPPEWSLVTAAAWALVTPRPAPESIEVTVPTELFDRRLADHTVDLPDDAGPSLAEVWRQPMYVWAMAVQPTGEGLLVLDAAKAGHYQVAVEEEQVTLNAVPSLAVWDTMVEMLDGALSGRHESAGRPIR